MAIALDRRVFLAGTGAGLVLAVAGAHAVNGDGMLNAWVSVSPDGTVTIRLNATDIGQGAQTGIAQIVADEMDADWNLVRVEMAPVVEHYLTKGDDHKGYYTGGSSSISEQYDMWAEAGATARTMLIAAAAKRWNTDPASCDARAGIVRHAASGRSARFGELALLAATLPLPKDVGRKPRAARNLVGRPVPRLDIPDKVCGKTIYGIDVKRPGMRIATILQCPQFGGKLRAVDTAPALAIKGVENVVQLENAVAVVARNFWSAKRGLDALSPQWESPPAPIASEDAMFATLRVKAGAADSRFVALDNKNKAAVAQRVDAALKTSHSLFEAEYQTNLIAHAGMEPMNATADASATHCEIWAPMQDQGTMRADVAKALGLPDDRVILHTTAVGGGFGRRLQTDYGVQAARIAREVGKPVKLIWSREEDFAHDFYRPATVARVRAALNDDATIAAIDLSGASTNDTIAYGFLQNYQLGTGVSRTNRVEMNLPIGSWRSVDPSTLIFFMESFVDEIAAAHKIDPADYRRRLLTGNVRALRAIDTVTRMAGWGKTPAGRAQGIAFFDGAWWGTTVAHVVEVSVDRTSKITVHRVFTAIDPGLAVNPNQVRAQTEGGILLGLSAALTENISLTDGRTEQKNFDSYSVVRLRHVPEIAIEVLESEGVSPGGVGEPPVPPIMPAVVNAVFAATGRRIRALPLAKSGFTV